MSQIKSTFKIFTWILAVVVVSLTSCSDDEDPVIEEANLVGGTWTYSRADAGNEIASALVDAFLQGSTYTFSSDGTYEQLSTALGEVSIDGTWEYDNATITLNAGDAITEEVWQVIELSTNTLAYINNSADDDSEDVTLIYTK